MKVMALVFILLSFNIFKVLYANENPNVPNITFPTFTPPTFSPKNVTDGCGGVADCIRFIGNVIYNIGAGIVFVILFVLDLIVYIFKLFALIIAQSFQGINGAPFWFNLIVGTMNLGFIAFILYRLFRSGESSA